MSGSDIKIYQKLICIISLISILISLIIIIESPKALGYEVSIYGVLPWFFWAMILIPLILPFILVINRKFPINKYTHIAILCSLFSLLIVLSLPIFRGYVLYGAGDTLSHLGMVKDIIYTGHVGFRNPYPIIHILIYNLASILNISVEMVALFLCQLFVLVYVASLYLLTISLNYNRRVSLLVLLFSIVPVMGSWLTTEYIMPSTQSFCFIPLALFLIIKSRTSNNNVPYSILLVILLVLFPFFHPESTVFLLIALIIFALMLVTNKFNVDSIFHRKKILTPILLLFIGFIAWFSSTYLLGWTISNIYDTFILNIAPVTPLVESMSGGIHINFFDTVKIIILQYGAACIYLLIGLIISLITFKKFLNKKANFNNTFLSLLFVSFVCLSIIFLFKGTSIGFHVYRQLKYPLMIATIFVGIYLFESINIKPKMVGYMSIIVLILVVPFLSLSSIYPSLTVHTLNYQVTNSDISGMNFFFNYRDNNMGILEIGQRSYQSRFKDYIYGYEHLEDNVNSAYSDTFNPPAHFGYNMANQLSTLYNSSKYLLIYHPYENFYPKIYPNYPNLWKYTYGDINKLNNDSSVFKVYDNGDFKLVSINK